MPIMFGNSFMNDPLRANQRERWRQKLVSNNKVGIMRAVNGVITRQGVYEVPAATVRKFTIAYCTQYYPHS